MRWLTKTPLAVLRAHVQMMERLKAEESMNATTTTALARRYEPSEKQWQHWQRTADQQRGPAPRATPERLRAMGIGVRKVVKGGR